MLCKILNHYKVYNLYYTSKCLHHLLKKIRKTKKKSSYLYRPTWNGLFIYFFGNVICFDLFWNQIERAHFRLGPTYFPPAWRSCWETTERTSSPPSVLTQCLSSSTFPESESIQQPRRNPPPSPPPLSSSSQPARAPEKQRWPRPQSVSRFLVSMLLFSSIFVNICVFHPDKMRHCRFEGGWGDTHGTKGCRGLMRRERPVQGDKINLIRRGHYFSFALIGILLKMWHSFEPKLVISTEMSRPWRIYSWIKRQVRWINHPGRLFFG